jgi:hypothetical protein
MNNNQLSITAMQVSELAKLLKQAGSRYASEAAVRKDIESGAPVNSDGTINLIHYTAWQVQVPAPRENQSRFSVPANAGFNIERIVKDNGA